MTDEFLVFTASEGDDLSSPVPAYGFPGLEAGTAGASARAAGGTRTRWASTPRVPRRHQRGDAPDRAA